MGLVGARQTSGDVSRRLESMGWVSAIQTSPDIWRVWGGSVRMYVWKLRIPDEFAAATILLAQNGIKMVLNCLTLNVAGEWHGDVCEQPCFRQCQ
jgi:hypothetical protein